MIIEWSNWLIHRYHLQLLVFWQLRLQMLNFNSNMQSYKIRLHKDRLRVNEDRNNLNSDRWDIGYEKDQRYNEGDELKRVGPGNMIESLQYNYYVRINKDLRLC